MASRANHRLLSGFALLCAAASLCADVSLVRAAEAQQVTSASLPGRLRRPAGGRRQANPLRPRSRQDHHVSRLYAGRSVSGGGRRAAGRFQASHRGRRHRARADQGVPLRLGDAGRLADRDRPDGTGADRQYLYAGCGQRPAAAAGAGIRAGRSSHLRSVARDGEPAGVEACDRQQSPGLRARRRPASRCHTPSRVNTAAAVAPQAAVTPPAAVTPQAARAPRPSRLRRRTSGRWS